VFSGEHLFHNKLWYSSWYNSKNDYES